jgi:HAD superfamily hydrolase (TIGR01484 family)
MLNGQGAELMQAVPNMLEIVPSGVNKRVGLDMLLEDLQLPPDAVMAIGDGGNDLHIVSHAGIGVAMGNAVPEVSIYHVYDLLYTLLLKIRSLTC